MKAKVTYEPFTSIDLETTGLDPVVDKILEVGAAFYNGIDKEPEVTIDFIVVPNGSTQNRNFRVSGQAIALVMNAGLLDEVIEAIKKREKDLKEAADADLTRSNLACSPLKTKKGQLIIEEDSAMDYLYQWLDHLRLTKNLEKKHILVGKNLNALDIPFLREAMGDRRYDEVISFRTLDLTSMFAPFVRQTKSLSYINKLRGLPEVSHRALQDAIQTGGAVIDIYEMNLQLPSIWNH